MKYVIRFSSTTWVSHRLRSVIVFNNLSDVCEQTYRMNVRFCSVSNTLYHNIAFCKTLHPIKAGNMLFPLVIGL